MVLRCQIQIEVTRRRYAPEEEERLRDLFGEPERWGTDAAHHALDPRQRRGPRVRRQHHRRPAGALHLRLQCRGDEVFRRAREARCRCASCSAARVLRGSGCAALQVAPISWTKEATFRLPVTTWRELMDALLPEQRLALPAPRRLRPAVRVQDGERAFPTWEQALERCCHGRGADAPYDRRDWSSTSPTPCCTRATCSTPTAVGGEEPAAVQLRRALPGAYAAGAPAGRRRCFLADRVPARGDGRTPRST